MRSVVSFLAFISDAFNVFRKPQKITVFQLQDVKTEVGGTFEMLRILQF